MRGVYNRVTCVCEQCGKSFAADHARSLRSKIRFCSRACMATALQGQNHWNWRGGRSTGSDYVEVFNPSVARRRQREHVVIAEQALGKQLPKGALVHHFDEDRANNENGNLVICQDRPHSGRRMDTATAHRLPLSPVVIADWCIASNFGFRKGKIQFRAFRLNRATGQRRRHMNGALVERV